MKKKSIIIMLITVLCVTLCGSGAGFALSESDLREDLDDVEQQQENVSNQMSQIVKDIKEAQAVVDNLTYQINKTIGDITDVEKNIKKKEKEMREREDNLNERLKVMYKNGSVGFIDILLGSNSISEFISNMEIIQKIYKNDMEVLEILEKEHEEMKQQKAALKTKKEKLSVQQDEMKVKKADLDKKKKELEKKEDELKAEADRLSSEILSLMDKNSPFVGGEFTWPCPSSSYITSSFGNRLHPILNVWKFHTGVDIGASSGQNILAAASGKVIMATWYGGYGNCVMIDHGGGIVTLYGHCSQLLVSNGATVKKGQVIALVGSTGNSSGPHLHFEVRENGAYVNPMNYFS